MKITQETKALILDKEFFENYSTTVVVASDKIEKIKDLCDGIKNVLILDDYQICANDLLEIGLKKFKAEEYEDIAYFTPFYLKEFIAGIPRVKGLR